MEANGGEGTDFQARGVAKERRPQPRNALAPGFV